MFSITYEGISRKLGQGISEDVLVGFRKRLLGGILKKKSIWEICEGFSKATFKVNFRMNL